MSEESKNWTVEFQNGQWIPTVANNPWLRTTKNYFAADAVAKNANQQKLKWLEWTRVFDMISEMDVRLRGAAEQSKLDPREVFKKEKKRFGDAVKIAIAVSKAAAGRKPDGNIVMASYVFTRMCIAADTLLYVLRRDIGNSKEQTLDHYSIGVLARNMIESALMFHYLSGDGVSKEEWELRIAIFNLHDSTLKVRLWKGLESDEQYKGWKTTMEEIRESLKVHPAFSAADPDQQKRLLSGQQLYVKGMRSTLKLVDLDEEYFDGMYAYLSAQVHITPSSFYWTHKRLNFGKPASYQYYFASYAVAHARMLFLRSAIRLAESDDAVRQKIDQATYDLMSELAAIPFGS